MEVLTATVDVLFHFLDCKDISAVSGGVVGRRK